MRVATVVVLLALMANAGSFVQAAPVAGKVESKSAESTAAKAPESAHRLMKDVIYNELRDWKDNSFWEYRSHVVAGGKNVLREQIDTRDGPVYRVLARDGQPLAGEQVTQEQARVAGLLDNPEKMRKVQQEHEADEARLGKVMALLPKAYVFHYAGAKTGDRVVLDFAPNPKYVPSSYVDRIMCELTGQVVVNQRLKRLVSMDGRIAQKISFGFGILGYVDPGGTFRIHRTQVSANHWKTDLVAVNVHGRILLFSNVSKQEQETRWGFEPVPHDVTLAEAGNELQQAAADYEARVQSATDMGSGGNTIAEGSPQH